MAKSELQLIIEGVDQFSQKLKGGIQDLKNQYGGLASTVGQVGGGIAKSLGGVAAAGLGTFTAAAGAGVAATGALGVGLGKLSKQAAPVQGIQRAFNGLTQDIEGGSQAMLQSLQDSSAGMLSQRQLMKTYNETANIMGTNLANKLPNAFQHLRKISAATGRPMRETLASLTEGIGRMSTEMLDNIGVTVDVADARAKAAKMFDKEKKAVKEGELQTAMWELAMKDLKKTTSDMPSVTDSAQAKFQQFSATMQDLKDQLGMAFMPAATDVLGVLSELADAILPTLVPFVETFASAISNLIKVFQPALDIFKEFGSSIGGVLEGMASGDISGATDALAGIIDSLVSSLEGQLPKLVKQGSKILMKMVEGITQALPILMDAGFKIFNMLLQALAPQLPKMMKMGLDLLMKLIEGILSNLPMLLETGLQIIFKLIQGVIQYLPKLLPLALKIITKFITSVMQFLPKVLKLGLMLIVKLITGVVQMLPKLLPLALDIIITLITSIIKLLPKIIQAGVDVLLALIEGIIEALPELIATIPELIVTIVTELIKALPQIIEAGAKILLALIEGIVKIIPQLIEAVGDAGSEIVAWFEGQDWAQIGSNLITSLKEGFQSAWENIKSTWKDLVGELPQAVKNVFGIGSPAKVFVEFGKAMPEGLAKGISDGMRDARNQMRDFGRLSGDFRAGGRRNDNISETNFNIYLEGTGEAGRDVENTVRLMELLYA